MSLAGRTTKPLRMYNVAWPVRSRPRRRKNTYNQHGRISQAMTARIPQHWTGMFFLSTAVLVPSVCFVCYLEVGEAKLSHHRPLTFDKYLTIS